MSKLKIETSKVFSNEEMSLLCQYGWMIQKSVIKDAKDRYNTLKSRYRSLDGLIQACYPNQNEEGRPTKKIKNNDTGELEWRSYKRITAGAAKNILIESLFNEPVSGTRRIIVEIHPDGDPVNKKTIKRSMKPDRMLTIQACIDDIRSAYADLEMVKDEEEYAYDNLPESLQCGEKGDIMQEAIDDLDNVLSMIDEALMTLDEVTNSIDGELIMEKSPWDELEEGDIVIHKSWGEGVVTNLDGKYIVVRFPSREARFFFPDAFERGFLQISM